MNLFELKLSNNKNRYMVFIPGAPESFYQKKIVNVPKKFGNYSIEIKRVDLYTSQAKLLAFSGQETATYIESINLN